LITVSQLAKEIGVSPQSIYKKVNYTLSESLKIHITKESGKTLIDTKGEAILKKSFNKPLPNVQQQFNNNSTTENTLLYEALIKQLEEKDNQLKAKDSQIDKLQILLDNSQQLHHTEQKKSLLLEHDKTNNKFTTWFKNL